MPYDLTARLRVRDDNFTSKMRLAAGETKKLQLVAGQSDSAISRMGRSATTTGSSFQRFSATAGSALTSVGSKVVMTGTAIASMGAAAVVAAAGFAAFAGSKSALKLAGDAEMASIAYETMLGSAEKSQKFLADLKKYAADSPFDLAGLRDSSRQMLGFGFASERVIPMLRNFSDASAGLGLGSDGIQRMTLAIGQMQAKGKVQGGEILQLAEMGIPAVQILADKMKITQDAVLDLTSKGLVPADKAIRVILDGLEKRYGGLSDKQSKTLTGMYNKLQDTFDNDLLKRWGDGIGSALYPRFQQLTKWIDENDSTIDAWGNNLAAVAKGGTDALISAAEGGMKYINDHFINNDAFNKLTTYDAKVSFVFDDVLATFNKWFNSTGKATVKSVADSVTDTLVTSISEATVPLTEIGVKLGGGIATGIASGLVKGTKNIPIVGSVLQAGSDFGTGVSTFADTFNKDGFSGLADRMWQRAVANFSNTPDMQYQEEQRQIGRQFDNAPRKATGLSEVPYNGYKAILHRGEEVLPAPQAGEYRRSGGAVSVTIPKLAETIVIREEADIDRISHGIANALMRLQGSTAQ
ncbi:MULTISPECIES: tape measure protein [unclassified Paenibacillus]|uniref:tape measure protein n=1 Tax=unclassified Paenibacillus TaxID=185978 RepID=UPI0036293D5E